MKRLRKIGESALKGIKQATIDTWIKGMEDVITKAEQEQKELDTVLESIVPKWVEAYNKGVSLRELAEFTNGEISHATIGRYIKEYAERHPEITVRTIRAIRKSADYIQEAKELKESMEKSQ